MIASSLPVASGARSRWLLARVVGVIELGALIAGICTVAAFFSRASWMLELTSHFRVQYLAYMLPAALVMAAWKHRRAAVVCAATGLLNLAPVAGLLLPANAAVATAAPDTPVLRALLLNVQSANTNHNAVISLIRESNADFVILEEVDPAWDAATSALDAAYPHRLSVPRRDNFGIKLMSRRPVVSSDVLYLDGAQVPTLVATYDIAGQAFTLAGTHPLPPVGARYAAFRNEHLSALAQYMASVPGPRLLLGDLNVTPWSPHFRDLLANSGLRNSSQGRGLFTTWPSFFWPLRISLDHCLHSDDIEIVEKRIGEQVGSDHLPVYVEFRVLTSSLPEG